MGIYLVSFMQHKYNSMIILKTIFCWSVTLGCQFIVVFLLSETTHHLYNSQLSAGCCSSDVLVADAVGVPPQLDHHLQGRADDQDEGDEEACCEEEDVVRDVLLLKQESYAAGNNNDLFSVCFSPWSRREHSSCHSSLV